MSSTSSNGSPTDPTVYILLINYQHVSETLNCLDSLKNLHYQNRQIIVIDNASGDDSLEILKQRLAKHPSEFHLIESLTNSGFSGGNNQGIQFSIEHHADYVWLLNNDTTVDPAALTHLVNQAETTGGLVGSKLHYPDHTYQQVGTRVNWLTGQTRGYPEASLADAMSIECLTGASLLIPIPVVATIGLMAEEYFLYFEDAEYTQRARRNGFSATLAIQSIVYHKEGASSGRKSSLTQYYFYRNRLKFLFTEASFFEKCCIAVYTGFRLFRSQLKAALSTTPEKKVAAHIHWLAIWDFLKGTDGPCPHSLPTPLKA